MSVVTGHVFSTRPDFPSLLLLPCWRRFRRQRRVNSSCPHDKRTKARAACFSRRRVRKVEKVGLALHYTPESTTVTPTWVNTAVKCIAVCMILDGYRVQTSDSNLTISRTFALS